MQVELPYWLQSGVIFRGAEGEDDDNSGEGEGEGEGNNDGEDDPDDEGGEIPPKDSEDTTSLNKALREERANRKKAEREKKALERKLAQAQGKDTPDIERLTQERDAHATRVQKLAEGFKRSAINLAIERAALEAGFSDPEDAVLLVDRSAIDVDQDEDEPDQVDVDKDSVKRAVKALADKKKHLLRPAGSGDGQRTGGQHNGGKKPPTKAEREAELRTRYKHL